MQYLTWTNGYSKGSDDNESAVNLGTIYGALPGAWRLLRGETLVALPTTIYNPAVWQNSRMGRYSFALKRIEQF